MDFFTRKRKSANNAKERLQLVLIHDRTDLNSAQLESLKEDLLQTIARHIDIDPQAVQIELHRDGRSQRLVANIPLRGVIHRRAS